MRVRHLNDIEIQALLDRRTLEHPGCVPGERYRKDLDSQEHLDNCVSCREELELYRELYAELGRPTTVSLPRNFARKVTFSLPPFRARRTRARLQLASAWGASLLISLFWLLGQISLVIPLSRLAVFMSDSLREAGLVKSLIFAFLPSPDLAVAWTLARATELAVTIQRAFSSDLVTVNLVIFAGVVVVMIIWLDGLYQSILRQKR